MEAKGRGDPVDGRPEAHALYDPMDRDPHEFFEDGLRYITIAKFYLPFNFYRIFQC
jgi:hypothetical protein